MSMEHAVSFYEKLEGDLELQKRISKIESQAELENFVKNELGYNFTKEEMQKVIFDRNPEMTDEELEAVVGGIIDWVAVGFALISIGVPAAVLNAAASAA